MSIDSKYAKKYKDAIVMLRLIGMDDYEINSKLASLDALDGWKPITLLELSEMSEDELRQLKTICWHDGHLRYTSIGITNLEIVKGNYNYHVSFSNKAGDPSFTCKDLNEVMDRCGDFEWMYGLFKKE